MPVGCQTLVFGPSFLLRRELPRHLETIVAHGFSGVEIAQPFIKREGYVTRPAELMDFLRDFQLELYGIAGGAIEERVRWCQQIEGGEPYLYVDEPNDVDSAIELASGIPLAIHSHLFSGFHRAASAASSVQKVRSELKDESAAFLMPDTAHIEAAGDQALEVLESFQDLVGAIHLKDWQCAYGSSPHRYALGFCNLGKGDVPIRAVLQRYGSRPWKWIWELDDAHGTIEKELQAASSFLADYGLIKRPVGWVPRTHKDTKTVPSGIPESKSSFPDRALTFENHLFQIRPFNFEQAIHTLVEHLHSFYEGQQIAVVVGSAEKHFEIFDDERAVLYQEDQIEDALKSIPTIVESADGSVSVGVPIYLSGNPFRVRLAVFMKLDPSADAPTDAEVRFLSESIGIWLDYIFELRCFATVTTVQQSGGVSSDSVEDFVREVCASVQVDLRCDFVWVFRGRDNKATDLRLLESVGEAPIPHLLAADGDNKITKRLLYSWELEEPRHFGEDSPGAGKSNPIGCVCPIYSPKRSRWGLMVCGWVQHDIVSKLGMYTDFGLGVVVAACAATGSHIATIEAASERTESRRETKHLLNQPLVSISNEEEKIERHTGKRGFRQDYLGDIKEYRCLSSSRISNAEREAAGDFSASERSATFLIRDVLAAVVRNVGPELRKRGFSRSRIDYDGLFRVPMLMVDRYQFQQMFINLISNAIKYAMNDPLSFNVVISGRWDGDSLTLDVKDWGIGVPESYVDEIFAAGFRVPDDLHQARDGDGLGLSIVKSIVENHDGRVWLESSGSPTLVRMKFPKHLVVVPVRGL